MNKRYSLKCALMICFLISTLLLSSCSIWDKPVITLPWLEAPELEASSLSLDIYDKAQLVILSGSTDNNRWESMNPSVATVDDNGLVTAVGEGNCEITLTNENGSASCYIVVTNSYTAPVLVWDNTEAEMTVGSEFIVAPRLLFKGNDVTDEVEISFILADGADDGVVTLSQAGNTATFIGKAYGKTQYLVFAEYNGVMMSKTVTFSVKEFGISFDATNLTPIVGGYYKTIDIYSFDGADTRVMPDVNVVRDKSVITGAKVSYTSLDTNIVKIEDGKLVAVNSGSTTVIGTYNGNSFNILVDVVKPETTAAPLNGVVQVGKLEALSFDQKLVGDFISARIGDIEVGDSLTNGNLKLSKSKLETLPVSSYGENVSLTIETSKAIYHTTIELYTLVICNEEDYRMMGTLSKAACADDPHLWGGYFVLGNSFTVSGKMDEFINRNSGGNAASISGADAESGNKGFMGVIDGRGYCIDGLTKDTDSANAFVTLLHKDGVIKNIGFTNVVYNATKGAVVVSLGTGTVSDIYVSYKTISNSNSSQYYLSGTFLNPRITAERIFIDASRATVTEAGKNFCLAAQLTTSFTMQAGNYIVIMPEGYANDNSIINIEQPREGITITTENRIFNSFADLKASEVFSSKVSGWNPTLWSFDAVTGAVAFGKTEK